jgi:deoxyguanosine kinase
MKTQHKLSLSIGSNQGHKKNLIQQAILKLHQEVGTVIAVSDIYKTKSWGFDSDDFFNCSALIHTDLTAEIVLNRTQAIENELGRIQKTTTQYQARLIDIDIIAFDHEVISTDSLTIPHPLMHLRNFVLQPMMQIQPDWEHPFLKKLIADLVVDSNDKLEYEIVEKLHSPIEILQKQHFNYLIIEGNIGAGKTTLSNRLAHDLGVELITERFAENPFLVPFYDNPSQFAFLLETSFMLERHKQLEQELSKNKKVIADYHSIKSLIFAENTLNNDAWDLYKDLFETLNKTLPKPNLYVFLNQNTDRLLKNIKKRGRDYEQNIDANYLDKINKTYLKYIENEKDTKILIIDLSDMDFVASQSDYVTILNLIQKALV